ncbi:probable tyrosyl-DNA phosphodiesterase [Phymastichus coffea]|uniref:probable tyrosyl-DNA phosphodiesterase n=1 Tax=Phymastichus coffea TaxID=108790 RepID=UPI00273AD303|nr:probable tyrosyl-DNA phosphodiesterase [Phymastichus coffea]
MEEEDLDDIKICINEDAKYGPNDMFDKRLNMSVNTWMRVYSNLITPDDRAKFRNVSTAIAQTFRSDKTIISRHGTFATKFESSVPYNFFLSTVDELEETAKQSFSVAFHEILDYTGGEIVESLHLNYMVELLWIITEYMLAGQDPKMTILYGTLVDAQYIYDIPFDINLVKVHTPKFGSHHSKVSILKYKNQSIRIIISTANYYYLDWQTRTQGLWISPVLPHLPENAEDTDGESVTNFKRDFIAYLSVYTVPDVYGWQALMHRTDFSAVKVFLLTSVPGYHEGHRIELYGHKRLFNILSKHAVLPQSAQEWPIIAQSSAIGVFGKGYHGWLQNQFAHTMAMEKDKSIIKFPEFKYIFPSQLNYSQSFDSQMGVTCLMYNEDNHKKQPWIKSFLHEWKSDKIDRTRAMPHCKCYTRISPDETEIPWFVLTSANVSKGAWGKIMRGRVFYINNYEVGVVFIPDILINQTAFPIKNTENTKAPLFLLPYDLPLTPYKPIDEPFVIINKLNEFELSTDKLNVQDQSHELTNIDEITRELKALGEDEKKEKEKVDYLLSNSNSNSLENLIETKDIINEDVEVMEESKEQEKLSEAEIEEQMLEEKKDFFEYDLFASL